MMEPKNGLLSIRNSNIELLRIVCMIMVVVLHFNNHGANNGIVNMPEILTARLWKGFIVESFCIVAVNCFVLISGYFSIRLKIKSLLKFYLQCFLIGLFSYLVYVWLTPNVLNLPLLAERLLAFTHNGWWFVATYLGLMLISPLLNRAVEQLSHKQMLLCIALYGVVVLYLGWYQGLEITNSGCSLLNFVFLYLIGRYIGIHVKMETLQRYRWCWLAGYVLAAAVLSGLVWIRYHYSLSLRYLFDYGHPVVIGEAVLLFLFFVSLSFQSKLVNWLASSVFAAYLIQESTYLGHMWLYPQMEVIFVDIVDGWRIVSLLGISIAFVVLSILIDKLLGCISRPICNILPKKCDFF